MGFSAHSGPSGEDPSGHLSQTIPEGKTVAQRRDRFRVTCLEVLVNEAALGLTPANAETAQNFPNGRVLAVRDNGNPAGGQPVDQFAYYSGLPSNCAAFVGGAVFVPAHGNILVHDEP